MGKISGINNHNSFAKIIKNLFHDDFVFGDRWYEKSKERQLGAKLKTNSEAKPGAKPEPSSGRSSDEDAWFEITSCRFKNTVFKQGGEFEKYILGYIYSNPDPEELERLISIYRSIFINSNSGKLRGYIEKECREVFYNPELKVKIKIRKYQCIHNKRKYLCVDCGGPQICEHKKIKYRCVDCGGSQICEHKKRKYNCKMCNSAKFAVSFASPDGFK